MPRQRSLTAAVAACAFAVVLGAATRDAVVDGVGETLAAVIAALCAQGTARRLGGQRAWSLAAAAAALWAAGQGGLTVSWAVDTVVTRPAPGDLFFVLSAPVSVWAVLRFPTVLAHGSARLRSVLDGAVVGGCGTFVAWQLAITPGRLPAPQEVLELTYAGVTCALVAILVGAASREARQHAVPLLAVATGLLVVAATNVLALRAASAGAAPTGVRDLGYVAGFALVAVGARAYGRPGGGDAPGLTTRVQAILPLLCVPVVLVVIFVRLDRIGRPSFAIAAGIALLLVARQYLVLDENRALAAQVLAKAREQLDAREALGASQLLYRRVVETAEEGIWLTDRRGISSFLNPQAVRMLGVPVADILGRPALDVMRSLTDGPGHARLTASAAERPSGKSGSYDLSVLRPDGKRLEAHVVVTPMFDPTGAYDGSVCMFSDITARVALEQELTHAANTDALTGLGNRAALHASLADAVRARALGALVYCDLDGFKAVNDSFGHSVGDALLFEVAARLRTCVRPEDVITRPGGDEFAVVLRSPVGPDDGEGVARRIVETMSRPFSVAGHELYVGASVGVAMPGDDPQVERLLRDADLAMYHAKNDGRGRYSVYDPSMHLAVLNRLGLEHDLRNAVERGELRLAYQPALELDTGRCVGVEALLRWHHPTRGLIPPDVFIPVAEETGSITAIGQWVIERACRDVVSWPDERLYVSINVAPRQLVESDLAAELRRVLAETGLPSSRVILEITERSLLAGDDTRRAIRALRDTGARVALDDFGTGWSSISHLREHPVDVLKLDRSYVGGVVDDPQTGRLVGAILQMSRSLGISCTAEGVEHQAQAAFLTAQGCGFAQGYLWAKPMPAEELLAWLSIPGPRLSGGTAPSPAGGRSRAR